MIIDIVTKLERIEPVPQRDTNKINGIALHHAGGPGDPYSWAPYHIQKFESGVIGYHSVVMRNGTVYKTAYDRDRTPGVANHNGHLVHICFQGNTLEEGLTPEQVLGGIEAINIYRHAYAIPIDQIKGHGEWADKGWETACPGLDLGKFFRTLIPMLK